MENLEVFLSSGFDSSIKSFLNGQHEFDHSVASKFLEQNIDHDGLHCPFVSSNLPNESVFCSLETAETYLLHHSASQQCPSMSENMLTNPIFPISQIPDHAYAYNTFATVNPDTIKRSFDNSCEEENGLLVNERKKLKVSENPSSSPSGCSSADNNPLLARSVKTRASRGNASDPQSLYARRRRERINERLRVLQSLVPNGAKVDISTMLEEAVHYVKFLQLQIKLLSSDDLWMFAPLAHNGIDVGLHHNKMLFSAFSTLK